MITPVVILVLTINILDLDMKNILQILIISTGLLFSQTTEQIKRAKNIIQQKGMTKSQVIDAAKQRGYTEKEINATIVKEKTLSTQTKNLITETSESIGVPDLEKSNEVLQQPLLESEEDEIIEQSELDIETQVQPGQKGASYFGYDIFSQDPALFQATSVGAVDPDYLIGPGDEIIIMLWGETQFRQVLTVNREGFVFVPEIGQVFVNGLDLNLLESKLFRVFSQAYASLNPQGRTPTTFLDVSLGNLRPLRIQVLGEIAQPGAYTVSPSATLFSALYYFNGPTFLGSLRDIQLIRGGKEIASIDFYDYLLTGKKPKDQKLQLDDVIFIPRRLKTVTIEGEVNRSGIYELKPEENLNNLITMAGDLKVTAHLGRCQIDRIVPFKDREKLGMDRMYIDVDLEQVLKSQKGFPLKDEDHIQIFSVLNNRQNVVNLRGAVTRPGVYELEDSLKISDLIKKAGGVLGDAYTERIDIVRINNDLTEELINVNLDKALEFVPEDDIVLKSLDDLKIYSTSEMKTRRSVSITGYVFSPGVYALQDKMRVSDLIFKSGGLVDEERLRRTHLSRADLIRFNENKITKKVIRLNLKEILESPDSKDNLILNNNDILRIYNKDIFTSIKPVTIDGVVRNPSTYQLKTNMSLKDLILEAGGINNDIYRYRVEIARIDPMNNNPNEYAETIMLSSNRDFIAINSTDKVIIENKIKTLDDFILKPHDLVNIKQDPYFKNQRRVTLLGEVLYPGDYTILNSNEKINDIINRSGGLLSSAYPEASQFIRSGKKINLSLKEILKNPNSKLNFTILDRDSIIIMPRPNLVEIQGGINKPGLHKYVPKKRLLHYLKLSGGLSPDADKENIWVEYPNGESKKYFKWSIYGPKIIDGSTIIVGKKEEVEPFNPTEYAKEITSIIANLAQSITILLIAIRG